VAVVLIGNEGKVLYVHHKTVLVCLKPVIYEDVLIKLVVVGLRVWAFRPWFKGDRGHPNFHRQNRSPQLCGWNCPRNTPSVSPERRRNTLQQLELSRT
jgi:hypothetical protein